MAMPIIVQEQKDHKLLVENVQFQVLTKIPNIPNSFLPAL